MGEQSGRQDGAYVALSYILAGLLLYGGLGWLGDRYLGTRFCLPAGIILGTVLSLYLIARRFGHHDDTSTRRRP